MRLISATNPNCEEIEITSNDDMLHMNTIYKDKYNNEYIVLTYTQGYTGYYSVEVMLASEYKKHSIMVFINGDPISIKELEDQLLPCGYKVIEISKGDIPDEKV